jgi:hypothetical protein
MNFTGRVLTRNYAAVKLNKEGMGEKISTIVAEGPVSRGIPYDHDGAGDHFFGPIRVSSRSGEVYVPHGWDKDFDVVLLVATPGKRRQ